MWIAELVPLWIDFFWVNYFFITQLAPHLFPPPSPHHACGCGSRSGSM